METSEEANQPLKAAPIIYHSLPSNKPKEGTDPFKITTNYDPFEPHVFSRGVNTERNRMKKVIQEGYSERERKEQEEKKRKENLERWKSEWEYEREQRWHKYDLAQKERESKKKIDKFKEPMIRRDPFFEPDP